ncbi:pectate lyase [Natrarchaeobius sp. A-rgal3]|uniref:pectate lyase n=1 Tax=Natrarchaeobius versutus TaxID=1679078 RepID=UPI00350FF560
MSTALATEIVDAVAAHVDTVLEDGRDEYGERRTPLLADAVDPETGEALPYDGRDVGDGRRLSNLAFQQEFLRTLVALGRITGTDRYREAAAELVSWAFDELVDSAGLLNWGGHAAYDLEADAVVHSKGYHELKFEYPFYEFLRSVDPDATDRFVEAFWNAHVTDWSMLDFNRHGSWDDSVARSRADSGGGAWDHDYEGGDVFFWGDGLTFVNTGSDLYYAAGLLAALTGDDEPLRWSKRLARRYVETRQEPGISGYQFSQHPSYCNGPSVRGDRAQYQFAPYVPGDHLVYEGTLFRPRPIVQRRQLALGDRLGERGAEFTRWAVEELRAWHREAYRPAENVFEPMLTDGLSLEGFVIRREGYFGPKGRIIDPIECGPEFLWTYASAFRIAGDEHCFRAAHEMARGLGLGDVGSVGGDIERDVRTDRNDDAGGRDVDQEPTLTPRADEIPVRHETLCALLEFHRATGCSAYLDAATILGRRLLESRRNSDAGAFTDEHGRVLLDDPVPLALLWLAALLEGDDSANLPTPVGTRGTSSGGF